jgi:hypothetical protein
VARAITKYLEKSQSQSQSQGHHVMLPIDKAFIDRPMNYYLRRCFFCGLSPSQAAEALFAAARFGRWLSGIDAVDG